MILNATFVSGNQNTTFVDQNNLFVYIMTQNTLFYGIYGDG